MGTVVFRSRLFSLPGLCFQKASAWKHFFRLGYGLVVNVGGAGRVPRVCNGEGQAYGNGDGAVSWLSRLRLRRALGSNRGFRGRFPHIVAHNSRASLCYPISIYRAALGSLALGGRSGFLEKNVSLSSRNSFRAAGAEFCFRSDFTAGFVPLE